MKKEEATIAARLWNEREEKSSFTSAKTNAIVDNVTKCSELWQVLIYPCKENDGSAFYNPEMLADIARAFHSCAYVSIRDGKVVGVIN